MRLGSRADVAGRALLVLLLAGACSRRDPLEVEKSLAAGDKGTVFTVSEPQITSAAQEFRPAIAAPRWVPARPVGAPTITDGKVRQVYQVGREMFDVPLVVKRMWKPKSEGHWQRLAPQLNGSHGNQLVVDFEVGDHPAGEYTLYIEAFALPPSQQSFTADPLRIAGGAVLVGGYGLSANARGITKGDVQFRIVAHDGESTYDLLDERRSTSADGDHAWSDYRIDLSRFAGKTLALEFATRFATPPVALADAVALPVWSVPRVLRPQPESKLRNVLLISLDTLRADFVGAYGKRDDTTPNIDRLAAQGVLFENVSTTYPSTTAAHMSMLTGVYPSVHGIYAPGKRLPDRIQTIAEMFSTFGYQTVGVTEDGMLAGAAGFRRGFGSYREFKDESALSAGHVNDVVTSAIEWLDEHRDERFFMFLHTYQVHDPYDPPPAFDVFKTYEENGRQVAVSSKTPISIRSRLRYAGDVLYTDSEVGRLLEHLDELGETANTVVVVTSDHGEALGEHGLMGHGWFVIEPVMQVPLIIRAPGVLAAGVRVATQASLVDVVPTLLELAGIATSAPMQGESLVQFIADGSAAPRERMVYAEKLHQQDKGIDLVAKTRTTKWLSEDGGISRYDILADPGEIKPIRSDEISHAGEIAFDAYRRGNDHIRQLLGDPKAAPSAVDEVTTEKLKALGYAD